MRIILASASPRRRELLAMLGVEALEIIPAVGGEPPCRGDAPAEGVMSIALAKAREVASALPDDCLVIAADTVVELDGTILGKPHGAQDAARMLRALSGRTHRVYTGVAVLLGGREETGSEVSEVSFRCLSEREIAAYVASGEPMDKAGAYGAQGKASLFVERINGDFFNVMGLPLCRLGKMLSDMGVDLI